MTEEQGTRPVLGHDKNGREVRAGDVEEFAQALELLKMRKR